MTWTVKDILDCPMEANGANADNIRGYLVELLLEVWTDGEGFSGKRPFGDSGWETDVYKALGTAGLVACEVDEDGYLDSVDSELADYMVSEAIRSFR